MIKNTLIAVLASTTVAAGLIAYARGQTIRFEIQAEMNARKILLKDVRNAKSTEEQLKILDRYNDEVEFQKIALRNS